MTHKLWESHILIYMYLNYLSANCFKNVQVSPAKDPHTFQWNILWEDLTNWYK